MVVGVCTIFDKAFLCTQGRCIWLGGVFFQPHFPPSALLVTNTRVPCVS